MVSVIVPVYNAEKYLRPCMESVLNQDYKDLELILVDDGSMDSSPQICQSYSDPRVKYIRKENGGVSSARNIALGQLSNGGYVTFLDSDDYLPADAISHLVGQLESTGADMVVGGFSYVYGDKEIPHSNRLTSGVYTIESLLPVFIDDGTLSGFLLGSVWAVLYRNDIILENNIRFDAMIKNNEDGLFNFEYALHAKKLYATENRVYCYRQYGASSTSKRNPEYDFNSLIAERLNQLPWNKDLYRLDDQLKARNVSLALWDVLKYPRSMKLQEGVRYISKRVNSSEVIEGFDFVRFDKLSKYKKVIAYLMRYRLNFLLWLTVKWVYPFLSSRLKR